MRGSPKSVMGEPFVASNKLAYSGHQELPISPDLIKSGQPARGLLLGDLDSPRSLRSLWFSNYPWNPPARHRERSGEAGGCVPRSQTSAGKTIVTRQ